MEHSIDDLIDGLWSAFYFRTPSRQERINANELIERSGLSKLVENLIESPAHKNYRSNVGYPPGHFYSALFNTVDTEQVLSSLSENEDDVFNKINVSPTEMGELWEKLSKYFATCPNWQDESSSKYRYNFDNGSYRFTDAITFSAIIQSLQPRKIIEVGAGYTTAALLDTYEFCPDLRRADLTLIQPFPHTIEKILRKSDSNNYSLVQKKVQDVELSMFEKLSAGDILFIDSTHVVKTGSDVVYEILEVLPRLAPGVWVHFHDIFYPFEYPANWIKKASRSWNEIYMLRAFLIDNPNYQIRLFNHYYVTRKLDDNTERADRFKKSPGGAIWLERTDAQ